MKSYRESYFGCMLAAGWVGGTVYAWICNSLEDADCSLECWYFVPPTSRHNDIQGRASSLLSKIKMIEISSSSNETL